MINYLKKYTGVLIRLDDVSENMNWNLMDKCELLFDKFKIKPLLGVIPNNQDPDLLKYPKNKNFWQRVKDWQKKGWEITMHGYSHLYTHQSDKRDIFNYGGDSEFYGLEYNKQYKKINDGIMVFKKHNIYIRSFFAPNHIYDQNTLKALSQNNIKIVIDGYGLFPFYKNGIFFIPQLFYKEIFLPFGIQSTQIHLNFWQEREYQKFKSLIERKHNLITDMNHILSLKKSNLIEDFVNLLVEKSLKTLRAVR